VTETHIDFSLEISGFFCQFESSGLQYFITDDILTNGY